MQSRSDIAGDILGDVPKPAKLGHEILELLVGGRQLATKWLEEIEEV